MQRKIMNLLKQSLKSPTNTVNLFNTQKRQFFFRSQGDYDFFTPLVNAGMWSAAIASAGVGITAYRYGYKQGLKETKIESSNSSMAARR